MKIATFFLTLLFYRLFPRLKPLPDPHAAALVDQSRRVYWRDYGRHVEHAISAAGIASYDTAATQRAKALAQHYWRGVERRNLPLEQAITGMRDGISRIKAPQKSAVA